MYPSIGIFFNLNITCSNTFPTIQQLILIQLDFSIRLILVLYVQTIFLEKIPWLVSHLIPEWWSQSVQALWMLSIRGADLPGLTFKCGSRPEPSRCRWVVPEQWPLNRRNSASLQESLQPLTQPWRGCGWWSFLLLVARCSDGLPIWAVAMDRNSDFRNWYFIHLVDTLTTQVNS